MAAFAFGAVPSGVDILNLVAIHACGADALVAFADMARGAADGTVRTLERELGRVVVERLDAAPGGFAMTIVALFAKTPLMRIVRLMAVEATSGCVAELYRLHMATGALYRLMCVPQLEIRKCVIECFAIELNDVGVAPLVIGMTMGAFLFYCIRLTPVKPLTRRTIGGNFLVTRKAEPRLRFS